MILRIATKKDEEQINRLVVDLPQEERVMLTGNVLSDYFEMKDDVSWSPIFVIEVDDQIVAYLKTNTYSSHHTAMLCGILTHRDHRGKGYATALLKHAIEYFNDQGLWKQISCKIAEGNTASIKVHEALGFKLAGTHEKDVWNGKEYIGMHKYILEQ